MRILINSLLIAISSFVCGCDHSEISESPNTATAKGGTSKGAVDPLTNAPVVAIYNSDWGWASTNPGPEVIVALWPDGRVVWSATNGGAPYLQGQFPKGKLDMLLDDLERKGVFTNQALTRANFGPDSSFTTIMINDGRRRLKMQSWHELYERNSNVVVTAHGVESLSGRSREQVLKEQSEEYRRYRATWSDIRQAVGTLIPEKGEQYDDEVRILAK